MLEDFEGRQLSVQIVYRGRHSRKTPSVPGAQARTVSRKAWRSCNQARCLVEPLTRYGSAQVLEPVEIRKVIYLSDVNNVLGVLQDPKQVSP